MLRVSVLELPARWDDVAGALAEVDALLARAPTDLAIVPELAFTGYVSPRGSFDVRRFAEPLAGPTVAAAVRLAARHATHLVVPLVLREEGALFNATVLVDAAGVRAVYRKRHPWIPETWAEPGAEPPPVVLVGDVLITFGVCYDAHFLPLDTHAELARAALLVFPSAWVDEEDSRRPLLASIARQFDVAVANANWGPGRLLVPGQGGSCVLDRRGAVLAEVGPGGRRADARIEAARAWAGPA